VFEQDPEQRYPWARKDRQNDLYGENKQHLIFGMTTGGDDRKVWGAPQDRET
jgi:hypothetical protein